MNIALHGHEFELVGPDEQVNLVAPSRQFGSWLARLDHRFRISRVEIQATDRRFDGGLLFAKLKAEVTDHEGQWVPGAVFLRGDAAAVLIVIRVAGRSHVVLVTQARFPAGQFDSVEIPAGMLDEGDPLDTAVREVLEETGISVTHDQMRFLGDFFPSGGGSDEKLTLYACEIEMAEEELKALNGASGGVPHEHERLRISIVPLEDLPAHTRDIKALLAYGCYRGWGMARCGMA